MEAFDGDLVKKPQILCINKYDLENVKKLKPEIEESLEKYDLPHYKLFFISTKNLIGINDLIKEIFTLNSNTKEDIKIKNPNRPVSVNISK